MSTFFFLQREQFNRLALKMRIVCNGSLKFNSSPLSWVCYVCRKGEIPVLEDWKLIKGAKYTYSFGVWKSSTKNTPFLHPSAGPTHKEIRIKQIGDQHITFLSDETDNRGSDIYLQQVSFLFVSSKFRQRYPSVTNRSIMRQDRAHQVSISSSRTSRSGVPQRQLSLNEKGAALDIPTCPSKFNQLSSSSFPGMKWVKKQREAKCDTLTELLAHERLYPQFGGGGHAFEYSGTNNIFTDSEFCLKNEFYIYI